jgi:hypothetical protein
MMLSWLFLRCFKKGVSLLRRTNSQAQTYLRFPFTRLFLSWLLAEKVVRGLL